MTHAERQRLRVVEAVLEGRLTQQAAGQRLELSVRQVKRLCRRVRDYGVAGLVSRRRGVPSNRRIDPHERARILEIIGQRYVDFGPTLAAEYLRAQHGYRHSTETLRQWMTAAGLWQVRRERRKRPYQLRERRPRLGELIQIDGSPHAWLEERGPRCTLIAFVDDATGRLMYARFERAETSLAYLRALRQYVRTHGRPVAFYSDRHSIFTKHDPEDPVPTQLERAIRELDIESILALSPQAKGRVERSFQTLQDRLVKGLRLAGACTLAQANEVLSGFVERYNERFGRIPADPADAHRPLKLSASRLLWLTSEHYSRVLSRSLTCSYRGRLFAIDTAGAPAYHLRGARITVCDDGNAQAPVLLHQDAPLPYRVFERGTVLEPRITDDKTLDLAVEAAHQRQQVLEPRWKPSANHPWRLVKAAEVAAALARSGRSSP